MFPDIERSVISSLYEANDENMERTIENLLALQKGNKAARGQGTGGAGGAGGGQGEEEDFLLFAHNCTQTELERLFSPPAPSASTSETQTRLTGFQEPTAVANTFLNTEDMYSHIETQTCDLQDLLS